MELQEDTAVEGPGGASALGHQRVQAIIMGVQNPGKTAFETTRRSRSGTAGQGAASGERVSGVGGDHFRESVIRSSLARINLRVGCRGGSIRIYQFAVAIPKIRSLA
jgi:hypothetical protein